MAANSKIDWTDHTFNPWWGCTKVSPACENCYAARIATRWGWDLWGKDKPRRIFGDGHWASLLRWERQAASEGRRYRVFCGSMCDVFEDHPSTKSSREKLFGFIQATPHLDWLLLTKRPENFRRMLPSKPLWIAPSPNVWLGVTVEDQKRADERIPLLLETPAAVRFVSCEPMLEPLNLSPYLSSIDWGAVRTGKKPLPGLDWVICGCESGARRRLTKRDWVRSLRDQCVAESVPFFLKQLNVANHVEHTPRLDGKRWTRYPETSF